MGAGSQGDQPAAKKPAHINSVVVITYFCGNCEGEMGTPDQFSLNDPGERGQVDPEAADCPFCQVPVSHKKIVVTEIA